MKIVNQSVELLDLISKEEVYNKIEKAGRICYKSEAKGDPKSFIRNIIKRGHCSVIEHQSVSFMITTDRGTLGEITRHRLASYSVESSRYVNYKNKEMRFIAPKDIYGEKYGLWEQSCLEAEQKYISLISEGANPEVARDVLPMSLATDMVMTANLREWRHFLTLRGDKAAHPKIRELSRMIYDIFKEELPLFVEDIEIHE